MPELRLSLKSIAALIDRPTLVVAMTLGAVSVALTLVGDYDDLWDLLAAGVFTGLAVLPYAGATLLSLFRDRLSLALWTARIFVGGYGAFDCWSRYQTLWRPQGSTDAIAIFTLPVIWGPILLAVSGVSAAVLILFTKKGDGHR